MNSIKKIIPEPIKLIYHKFCGLLSALVNGFPAKKMIIIGITGTKGKTSTANYIWSVLTAGGYTAGLISSANFRIGNKEEINPFHMTMPNPFFIQKKLKEMKDSGVEIVAMEMTSEGMKQYRHTGINVDIAVFTNLTPEHLNSHKGSFEEYKRAKSPVFKSLNRKQKILNGKFIQKTIIANADSEHSEYFLSFKADKKITYGINKGEIRADEINTEMSGTSFNIGDEKFRIDIPGIFNLYNALPAIIVGQILKIPTSIIKIGLSSLKIIPGRMESIQEGQGFSVFVDYAHEPAGLGALLETAKNIKTPNGKIILLTGCIGGGRASRKPMISLASKNVDHLIITTEDPYDENPDQLISELSEVAKSEGMKENENLFPILNRKTAIIKALSKAQTGDIVLITGKGAETTMMTKSGPISWNERAIVRELVKNILNKKS